MVIIHKEMAKGLANIGFIGGTIVIAAGIYALLRGDATEGAVTISAGVSLAVVGVYNLVRLDSK